MQWVDYSVKCLIFLFPFLAYVTVNRKRLYYIDQEKLSRMYREIRKRNDLS